MVSKQGIALAAACAFALPACLVAPAASAQGYPSKPVRVVIGYAPGGSADAGIRPLARALEPLLGQPVIIENKPGNAGGVAMEFIAKAPADGYTLYYFDSGPLTVAPLGSGERISIKRDAEAGLVGDGNRAVDHPRCSLHQRFAQAGDAEFVGQASHRSGADTGENLETQRLA